MPGDRWRHRFNPHPPDSMRITMRGAAGLDSGRRTTAVSQRYKGAADCRGPRDWRGQRAGCVVPVTMWSVCVLACGPGELLALRWEDASQEVRHSSASPLSAAGVPLEEVA